MKLWVDDARPAPDLSYFPMPSVNLSKAYIEYCENEGVVLELIDIGHDAGFYVFDGGDYINLLNWLEETGRNYPIKIHSMNSVGVENMRRIIKRNGWREIT